MPLLEPVPDHNDTVGDGAVHENYRQGSVRATDSEKLTVIHQSLFLQLTRRVVFESKGGPVGNAILSGEGIEPLNV